MKTILIIENYIADAEDTKEILTNKLGFDRDSGYNVEIYKSNDNSQNQREHQQFYNDSSFVEKLTEKIAKCDHDQNPVTGIIIDIFLTENEEKTLNNGRNYLANTSCRILKSLGDAERNGLLSERGKKKNFVIVSRFPQYRYYAKDLSGDTEWTKYYISKLDFFDETLETEVLNNIKNILQGSGHSGVYGE